MKAGDRVTIKGQELAAVPYKPYLNRHVCTGYALFGKPECITPRCGSQILVPLHEAVARQLLGGKA